MSDLPRLLLCCFDVVPAPTAISRRMTEYLKGLSDRYQVVVLSVKTPDHTHIERYCGARLLRVPVGSGDFAARAQAFDRAVRRQLESEEYLLVHFFDPFGGYALCERRAELGYKLVYDACALPSVELPFLLPEAEANHRFLAKVRRQELFCLMNADVVVVANDITRDFVAGLGVPREQVTVLPAPIDLAPYLPSVMGQPDSTPMRLVHLGNQGTSQDLSTGLEALRVALQTVDVRLVVVGPRHPEQQARLEEQVGALKLTGKVEFQPPVSHDDLHKVLATVDVGLLTLADVERNTRVGSPLSRLGEYLAAGRPVIAADVPAARAVLPEEGVVLYRAGDAQSLADAIVSLATDPARRMKLGNAARAASVDRDAAKVRADLVAVYVTVSGAGVREVGDAEAVNPDEVTQLGRSLEEDSKAKKRRKKKADGDSSSGTGRVKTDPAIAGQDTSPDGAGADRPAVMGVPLREEPPVVVAAEARALAHELAAQVTTEPNAQRPTEPPIVMGSPLPDTPPPGRGPTPGDVAAELAHVEEPPPRPTAPAADVELPTRTPIETPRLDSLEADLSFVEAARPSVPPLDDEPFVMQAPASAPRPPVLTPPPRLTNAASAAALTPVTLPGAGSLAGLTPAPAPPGLTPHGAPPVLAPVSGPPVLAPVSGPPVLAPVSGPPVLAPVGGPPVLAPVGGPPVLAPVLSPVGGPPVLAPLPRLASAPSVAALTPVTAPGAVALPPVDGPLRPLELPAAPALAARPAPATSSGPASESPEAMTKPSGPPKPSGLFPEAPSVPGLEDAEAISEDEIVAVGDGEAGDEPEEVGADEVEEISAADAPSAAVGAAPSAEPDEPPVAEAEAVQTVDTEASPPPSAIDPWLAQLVHGYCPPEADLFDRHTPPTTMPGRDT